jgi:phage tail-like protein
MAPDDGSIQGETWPLVKFWFEVDFGTTLKGILFQEVSGLEAENEVIKYRALNSPLFSKVKMPGIAKYNNITMKKAAFPNNNSFWDWYAETRRNTTNRGTILIKLLDEAGKIGMQWLINDACISKITLSSLSDNTHEVAVEKIEIAYQQSTFSIPSP